MIHKIRIKEVKKGESHFYDFEKENEVIMACEITVTVKDEEKRLIKKFLVYEKIEVNENDPIIKGCVDEVIKDFGNSFDSIKVRINLEIN